MLTTLSGIVTVVSEEQPTNVLSPIVDTPPCGIVTFVMPVQRSNARSPIIVTLDGIVTLVMPDW